MKAKNKIIIFLLISLSMSCYSQFAGGSGTYEDPWLIRTPQNLDSLHSYLGSENSDKYFKQIADIDLGVAPWNEGLGWKPIGVDSLFFEGYYNGNGFKIMNMTISRSEENYIGLFGYVNWSQLQNIYLTNVNISGNKYVGSLSGFCNAAEIYKCSATGNIQADSEAGGLFGACDYIGVFDCFSKVNVTGLDNIGGIIGQIISPAPAVVVKSFSIGNIAGVSNLGGLIGSSEYDNSRFSYWNTETSGQLTSEGGEGRTTDEMTYDYPPDTYKYWDFTNTWTEDLENKNNGYPFLKNQLSLLIPSAPNNLTASCLNGQYTIDLSWNNPDTLLNGDSVTELTAVHLYRNFDLIYSVNAPIPGNLENYTDIVTQTGNYTYKVIGVNSNGYGINSRINQPAGNLFDGGNGTEAEPYLVSNAEQLNNIRYYTGKDSVCFKQTDTIDLGVAPWNEGKGWIPIGHDESEFKGSYFGTNEFVVIINLTINDSTRYYSSLFGAIRNADIDNVHLTNVNIYGNASCGALVGNSFSSKISNCSAFGSVSGYENEIGGLIGASIDDSIFCCYANVKVSGKTGIGGLIGLTIEKTAVKNCYSTGDVNGYENVGGLIGVNFTSVPTENCYSLGYVSGSNYLGGLLSQTDCLPIHCYWNTETSGQTTSAGGEGKTTWEMWNYDTYVDWDFENIWQKHYQSGHPDYPVLFWQSVGIEDNSGSIPHEITLEQNYPNPFNPVTEIRFSNQKLSHVKLSVYNVNGQKVAELVNRKLDSGTHSVLFDGARFNSGVYYYTLEADCVAKTKKMILIK